MIFSFLETILKKPPSVLISLVIVLTISAAVLTGWMVKDPQLVTILPNFPAMVFNTAFCFFLSSAAIFMCLYGKKILPIIFSFIIFLVSGFVFLEYISHPSLDIDQIFYADFVRTDHPYPGRMAIFTTVAFMLESVTIMLLCYARRTWILILAEIGATAIIVIGFVPLTMYVTGFDIYVGEVAWNSIALHTALSFVFLGYALLNITWSRRSQVYSIIHPSIACIFTTVAVTFDAYMPLGISSGVAYIPLVFCAIWYKNPHAAFLFAFIGSMLTIGGLSITSGVVAELWVALTNRCISVLTLWVLALLVYLVKSRETAIITGEQRLKAILDNTVDGIITIDEKGSIIHYNKACERIFGYSAREVGGRNVKMLMPEPYHSEHDGYLKNYRETQEKKIIGIGREVSGRRKDGSTFPIDLSVNEVHIQDRIFYSGIIRDITQRKKAEMALLESEQRYDIAVKGMGVGLWDWNIVTGKNYWSPTFMDIIGFPDKLEPDIHVFESLLHPDDREKTIKALYGHINHKNPYDVEYRILHGDGHYIWVRACGLAIWDSEGRPIRMAGSINDITTRKNAEEEVMRSNLELERFAYIASHDLQEPLRMVANFTSLLESDYGEGMDDQARQYMVFIIDAARRMQTMISDLLEYSRIGYEETGFEEINAKAHAEIALENLKEAITETKAEVFIGDLPAIYANPVRFSRLLQNFIGNGIKYRSKDRNPEIHIDAQDQGGTWLFSISDNGIGIKQEYLEQIFVIFKRLHGKSDYQGNGIGLAICKKIIESMGGQVWAESESGKGSVFYFTIPKRDNQRRKET